MVVRLEPKTMEVLVALARNSGRVVTREQLLEEVWPGVVVGDAALTQAVIKLRKALGDTAQAPTFIETIPKRGYRLLLPPEATAVDTPNAAAPSARANASAWRLGGALLALLVGSGLYGAKLWNAGQGGESAQHNEESLVRLAETLPAISVQPFEIVNESPRVAALAKGLGWEVGDRLGLVSGLRVFASDGRNAVVDPQSRARYLVSGTVQSGRGTLLVSVRLVDRQSGSQLWSERFERPVQDILGVQEDIAQRLVAALPVQVSEAERRRLALRYTRNLDAYDGFAQGHAAFLARTAEDNARARQLFRGAIELDPQFARAYVGIALSHIEDFRLWREQGREESLAEARRMAEAAYLINPALREVHWVRSYLAMHERRHDTAIAHLRQALAIDPSYADAYALFAWIHTFAGESAKAVPMMRTAMYLNPGAGHIYFAHLGAAYYFLGDQEQALINLNEARTRNLADVHTRVWLAATLLAAGQKDEALWEADEVRAMRPEFSGKAWLGRMPMQHQGQRQRLAAALGELGL